MARPEAIHTDSIDSDSFLGGVTSIVAILIILVIIAGMRVQQASVSTHAAPSAALEAEINRTAMLQADVHALEARIHDVEMEFASRQTERQIVGVLLAAAEQQVATGKQDADNSARRSGQLERDVSLAKAELARLDIERAQLLKPLKKSVQVENYPTPLSKTVDNNEAHIQLKNGRVTVIPIDELLAKFKSAAQAKVDRLRELPEYTDVVGPIDGFHLRYTLVRDGVVVRLRRWELIPVSSQLGEPLATALSSRSQFRARLDELKPGDATITLWTYPDSFEVFRAMRKELYQLGFAVAGRPLPDGVPIGGSPRGSRSAAE